MQGNRTAFHWMAVDKRPAAQISEIVTILVRIELGMVIDDMRIVDANVALRVTPDKDGKFIQRKTFPGVRTMFDMKSGPPRSTG